MDLKILKSKIPFIIHTSSKEKIEKIRKLLNRPFPEDYGEGFLHIGTDVFYTSDRKSRTDQYGNKYKKIKWRHINHLFKRYIWI